MENSVSFRLSRRLLLRGGAAALLGAGLAPILAACGPSAAPSTSSAPSGNQLAASAPSNAPVKFQAWFYNTFAPRQDEVMKQQVEDWAKTKPNVQLDQLVDSPDNVNKRETVSVAAGAYPDLWDAGETMYRQFLDSGAYLDTTGLYNDIGKQYDGGWVKIAETMANVAKQGDKKLFIPHTLQPAMFMYRGDILDQKNIPVWTTWEELYAAAKQVSNPPDIYGTGLQLSWTGDAETLWMQTIIAYGGTLTDKSGEKLTIKSPETLEALTFIKKTYTDKSLNSYPPGVFQWDDASDNTAYQERHCFTILNPASVLVWMENNDPDLLKNTRTIRSPFASKSKQIPNDLNQIEHAFIVLNTKQQDTMDLAQDLVHYLFKPENYTKLINIAMDTPTLDSKELAALPRWTNPAHHALLDLSKESIWQGWPAESSQQWGEFGATLPTAYMITRLVQNDWTPEQALDEYYNKAKTIWEKHGFKQ